MWPITIEAPRNSSNSGSTAENGAACAVRLGDAVHGDRLVRNRHARVDEALEALVRQELGAVHPHRADLHDARRPCVEPRGFGVEDDGVEPDERRRIAGSDHAASLRADKAIGASPREVSKNAISEFYAAFSARCIAADMCGRECNAIFFRFWRWRRSVGLRPMLEVRVCSGSTKVYPPLVGVRASLKRERANSSPDLGAPWRTDTWRDDQWNTSTPSGTGEGPAASCGSC